MGDCTETANRFFASARCSAFIPLQPFRFGVADLRPTATDSQPSSDRDAFHEVHGLPPNSKSTMPMIVYHKWENSPSVGPQVNSPLNQMAGYFPGDRSGATAV